MEHKGFKKAVTIFIDILGTQDRNNFNELYEIANVFHNTVEQEKNLDSTHLDSVYKREIHLFSDCAYIIYDYKDGVDEVKKNMYDLMSIACYNTEKVLYEFLKNNFIARGALTYGDIYYEVDRNICFGPAMNKAYALEVKEAKYPRVIIDPEYADELFKHNEKKYIDNNILKYKNGEILKKDDEDGLYYIHYLNLLHLGLRQNEDSDIIRKVLDLCKMERSKERETNELRASIKAKYDWLEKYAQNSLYRGRRIADIDINDAKTMEEIKENELEFIKQLWNRENLD